MFALTNLPETVKGALFARYSRYQGTLRRLYLDEFAADVPSGTRPFDGAEGERAAQLYERIFIGYGDDSVAQLGGAHLACEWVSNVLTKVLQRGRLAAYLEQSTRYIPYDTPIEAGGAPGAPGSWRYWRGEELGPEFGVAMDEIFSIYSATLKHVRGWAEQRWPRGEEPQSAWERSIKAKALDLLRGLLPAATLSHVGIYASGQAYEQLLLRLASSPLPEAREVGAMALEELGAVIPSFISRVGRPERGGEWISYLEQRRTDTERWVARLGLDRRGGSDVPSVELIHVDGDEDLLLAASLYEATGLPESEIAGRIGTLDPIEREGILADLVGERGNRRHRPGRGWEAVRYRFEVVSDYGGFRDLQRHRMLTCQWQSLGPDLGAGVPDEVREAGAGDEYARALEISRDRVRAARGRGAARGRPLRALPRLPDPLRPRHERPRGDARLRAALRPRRPPDLPRRRPGHARADQRRPPGDRGRDAPRRLELGATPGADHERDPHPPQAGGAGEIDQVAPGPAYRRCCLPFRPLTLL